jgi:hypothetical protein
MKRFSISGVLGTLLVAGIPAVAPAASTGGTISGFVDTNMGPSSGSNELIIKTEVVVTARDPAGTAYGKMSFGKAIRDENLLLERVPFTIVGLPYGTPLTVTAGPRVAPNATPVPRGFYMTFTTHEEHISSPPARYTKIVLTSAAPRETGVDFIYAPLEVVPALPEGTPAPSPSPTP